MPLMTWNDIVKDKEKIKRTDIINICILHLKTLRRGTAYKLSVSVDCDYCHIDKLSEKQKEYLVDRIYPEYKPKKVEQVGREKEQT